MIKFSIKPNNHKARWLGQLRGYLKRANQKEKILEHLQSLKRTEATHRNKGTNSNGNEQNKRPSKKSNAKVENEMTKKTDNTVPNVIVRGGEFFREPNNTDNKHKLIDLMQKHESFNEFSRLIDDAEEKVIDCIYKEIGIKPETHVGRRKQKLCKMLIDGQEREKILALLEQGQCYKNIRKIAEASDKDTISVILNDLQIKPEKNVERRKEQLYQAFLQSQEKDKIARLLIDSSRYSKVKAVIDASESIIIENTLAQLQIEPDNHVDRRKLQLWTLYLKSAESEKERICHILDDMEDYTKLSTRLSITDETVIDCILSKLMIQPDIHVPRRKNQILEMFIASSCREDLFECINEIIDHSHQYDLLNKKLSEANDVVVQSILKALQLIPDNHLPRRQMQILQTYKESSSKDQLFRCINRILDDARQYDAVKQKLSEANDVVVQSILQKMNIEPQVHVPRRKHQIMEHWLHRKAETLEIIDEVMRGDDILTLIDNASLDVVTDILKKMNKTPNKKMARRRNQLIKFCGNSKDEMKILEMLKKNAEASYKNDFLPDNIAEILEKQEILKNIRAQRVEGLETGQFNLLNQESVNPIFEAGADVSEFLSKIKYNTCKICKERWPEMSVGPKSGKCHRCSMEKVRPGIPYTFSMENDMDPGQQPECLKILNTVEVAAISLRCPMLCVYKLKGGATGLKGHSISFPQDVQGFVNRLPRRPEDLPIVIIKAPKQQVPLRADRIKMLNALEFLIGNNPHYADITIDQESLSMYPSNSQEPLSNVRTIDSADIPQTSSDEAETAEDAYGNPADHELVESLAQCQVPGKGIDEQIRTAVGVEQEQVTLEWPERHNRPSSEWEPGYFSMAFPNLFPYGAGDITKPRIGKNPEFLAYLRHLTRLEDNRFAADPRFLLHTISMYRRHKALTLGNVYATNVCNNMSLAELKQKVQEDDEAVMKSLTLFSAQIPGTKGYFGQEAKKAAALEKWLRITSNGEEMFNVFLTFSMPDRHINELHRLLPGSDAYLNKKVIPNLSEIPPDEDPDMYIDEKTDYMLRSRALNQNGGIVDWFAQKKITLLTEKVLREALGIVDYIIRSEYQSRSSVHWHMAGRMVGLSMDDIKRACAKYDFDVQLLDPAEFSSQEMRDYEKKLKKDGYVFDHPQTDEFKQEVLDSRDKVIKFATQKFGLSSCHPQADPKLWPGPEGQAVSRPRTNCLRTSFPDVQDLEEDYESLVNRVQLHTCTRAYCKKNNTTRCRFGFPLPLRGFEHVISTGPDDKGMLVAVKRKNPSIMLGAEIEAGNLELLRNHERVVGHVPELLSIWRGNIEQKLIKSPQTLLKYILKYMFKPEEGSLAFTDIVKTLTNNAEDNEPVRKVFQRILLKLVGEHDISKNEAWRIVSGESYVHYSRPFTFLNLTSSRKINVESAEGDTEGLLTKNFCDIYWARDSDPNFARFVEKYESGAVAFKMHPNDISLYTFAESFTSKWMVRKKLAVPKPTPYFYYVPSLDNKEYRNTYCETTLLLHKPGTNIGNMLNDHDNAEEALLDFVNTDPRCPRVIREEYIDSLKLTSEQVMQQFEAVEDLVGSPPSQGHDRPQDAWMIGLGDIAKPTNILDPEPEDEQDHMNISVDENIDWRQDQQDLGLSDHQVDELTDFITTHKASTHIFDDDLSKISSDSLNEDQRRVYTRFMSALSGDAQQLLIDVSGGAGTGKSHLIKCILKSARELAGHSNGVRIAAPTGTAASHFPAGMTLHSLLKIPARENCNELEPLTGNRLKTLQETFKDTKALIIDEKGMIGLGRLSQIDGRLREAKPEKADKPFGGMTLMISGDLRQLPPVGDIPLFRKQGITQKHHQRGRVLYQLFDCDTYHLNIQQRQTGAENEEFRNQLERLAAGEFTVQDWTDWMKQDLNQMSKEEQAMFYEEATMLCAKKKDMAGFNTDHLKDTGNDIAKLSAVNTRGAAKFESDKANGLQNVLYLAKGAKVVLTSNLWSEAKLVNGSQGEVIGIIYKGGKSTKDSLPDVVLVRFPEYTGPSCLPNQEKIVPLTPQTCTWIEDGKQYSRTQYPLLLSWALTIHKAQGMTLGKVIINLSEKEFANGLTYTAVTRVRKLVDMAFSPFPNFFR